MAVTVEDLPAGVNFTMADGATFSKLLTFTGQNLTGYTFAAPITGGNTTTAFTVTNTDLANGKITISLTSAQWSALPIIGATYTLSWTTGGVTTAIFKGQLVKG